MHEEYFYKTKKDRRTFGPLTEKQLLLEALHGRLGPDDTIWIGGTDKTYKPEEFMLLFEKSSDLSTSEETRESSLTNKNLTNPDSVSSNAPPPVQPTAQEPIAINVGSNNQNHSSKQIPDLDDKSFTLTISLFMLSVGLPLGFYVAMYTPFFGEAAWLGESYSKARLAVAPLHIVLVGSVLTVIGYKMAKRIDARRLKAFMPFNVLNSLHLQRRILAFAALTGILSFGIPIRGSVLRFVGTNGYMQYWTLLYLGVLIITIWGRNDQKLGFGRRLVLICCTGYLVFKFWSDANGTYVFPEIGLAFVAGIFIISLILSAYEIIIRTTVETTNTRRSGLSYKNSR